MQNILRSDFGGLLEEFYTKAQILEYFLVINGILSHSNAKVWQYMATSCKNRRELCGLLGCDTVTLVSIYHRMSDISVNIDLTAMQTISISKYMSPWSAYLYRENQNLSK
jgi:hypothetical protein